MTSKLSNRPTGLCGNLQPTQMSTTASVVLRARFLDTGALPHGETPSRGLVG